jgi:hypothetical protein
LSWIKKNYFFTILTSFIIIILLVLPILVVFEPTKADQIIDENKLKINEIRLNHAKASTNLHDIHQQTVFKDTHTNFRLKNTEIRDFDKNVIKNGIYIDSYDFTIQSPVDIVEKPENLNILINATGYNLSWTATCTGTNCGETYQIYKNDTLLIQENWVSGNPIIWNLENDTQILGKFIFKIVLFSNTHIEEHEVEVIIYDPEPSIKLISKSQFEIGYHDMSLRWNISDNNPNLFDLILDTEVIQTGSWENSTFELDISNKTEGIYNYTLIIYDKSNQFNKSTVIVHIHETLAPQFISYPSIEIIEFGSLGNALKWLVIETHPDQYKIFKNDNLMDFGYYENNTAIELNIDGLELGKYNFTIYVNDTLSLYNLKTTLIDVIDSTKPHIETVSVIDKYGQNSTGNEISWKITELLPDQYEIYRNNTLIQSGIYNNEEVITLNIDGLSAGVYVYTFLANDTSGNFNSLNHYIEVIEITNPVIELVIFKEDYQYGTTDNEIGWQLEDEFPGNYRIFRNETIIDFGDFYNGEIIIINIDGLDYGIYNFTIVVINFYEYSSSHSVIIEVVDTLAPEIEQLDNITMIEDSIGNILSWTASDNDPSPGSYEIYLNGSLFEANDWFSGEAVEINIDHLLKGIYNFTIIINDVNANSASSTVFVTVLDLTSPELHLKPTDQVIGESYSTLILQWNSTDRYASNYQIYLNETKIYEGNWDNESIIEFDLLATLTLLKGFYNLTIIIFDKSQNQMVDSIIIQVIDDLNPVIVKFPDDQSFFYEQKNSTINWTVFDHHPDYYEIYVNGSLLINLQWKSNKTIPLDLFGYTPGIYKIDIKLYDTSGNIETYTVVITIKIAWTNEPQFEIAQNVKEGYINNVSGSWVGVNGPVSNSTINIIIQNDLEVIRTILVYSDVNGEFNFSLSYENLPVGDYFIYFTFLKYGYQNHTILTSVTINPHYLVIEIYTDEEFNQNQEFSIYFLVYYVENDETLLLTLNELIKKLGEASGIIIDVILEVEYSDTNGTLRRTLVTGSDGSAIWTLSQAETRSIFKLISINAIITETDFYNGSSLTVPETELPEIHFEQISVIEILRNILVTHLSLVFLTIVVITIFGIITTKLILRLKSKYSYWQIIRETALEEINSLNTIQSIFLQNLAGVPLFQLDIKRLGVDTTLISGMTSALSSFLTEITETRAKGFEIIERDKLSMTIHVLNSSLLVFISDQILPKSIMHRLENVHKLIDNIIKDEDVFHQLKVINFNDIIEMFEENKLRIGLLTDLMIDEQFLEQASYEVKSGQIFSSINFVDFVQGYIKNPEKFTKNDFINFYKRKGYSETIIARLLITVYDKGIIKPVDYGVLQAYALGMSFEQI